MDLTAIIKELTDERDLVEQAIISVEKMAHQRGKLRGRPPEWMTLLTQETEGQKKRRRPKAKKRTAK